MKKEYFAPEVKVRNYELESALLGLSNDGDGTWSQPIDDSEEGSDDDGRAKSFSVWED